jgi:Protein of unknown function (DUF4236)
MMTTMSLRFRRRLRITRGVWQNVAKRRVSTSIGEHGATLNVSKRGTQTTLGLRGPGLSYRSKRSPLGSLGAQRGGNVSVGIAAILALAVIAGLILLASL